MEGKQYWGGADGRFQIREEGEVSEAKTRRLNKTKWRSLFRTQQRTYRYTEHLINKGNQIIICGESADGKTIL